MIVREVIEADSEDIFLWRNDPYSRSMSKKPKIIEKSTHIKWFNDIIKNKNSYLYIGLLNNTKVGVVRFDCDLEIKKSLVSINLNPKMRGRGLSSDLLSTAIKKLLKIHKLTLCASIKKGNLISKKIFQKCGFNEIKTVDGYDYFLLSYKNCNF